jgi:hypothetical protein
MKQIAITALVGIAIWLVFSLPGSTQNKGSNHIEKKADDNKYPAKALAPAPIQFTSNKNENPTKDVAGQNDDHPIRIDRPVAVNSIKDRWDKSLVFLTGAIIIVGIFQIFYLWKTVNATSKNADALINSERTWVLVDVEIAPSCGVIKHNSREITSTDVTVSIKCSNEGKSPAWITEKRVGFIIEDKWPDYEPNIAATHRIQVAPEPMKVGGNSVIEYTVTSRGQINYSNHAFIYGCVTYNDVFGKDRETRFGYQISADDYRTLTRIEMLPEWNKHS